MPNTFTGGIGVRDIYNSPVTAGHLATSEELGHPYTSNPPSAEHPVKHAPEVAYGDKEAGEGGLHDHNLEAHPHHHPATKNTPNEVDGLNHPHEKESGGVGAKIKGAMENIKEKLSGDHH